MDLNNIRFKQNMVWLLAFQIVLFEILGQSGFSKYVFAVGVAGLLFVMVNKRTRVVDKLWLFVPWLVYLICGLGLCIYQQSFNGTSVKQLLFYFTPLVVAFLIATFCENYLGMFVDVQYIAIVVAFLIWGVPQFARVHSMESQYAFILGAYAIYYLYYKRFVMMGSAVVFMYLADKRIAMLAVFAVAGWIVMLWLFKKDKTKVFLSKALYSAVILFMYGYIYLIKTDILLRVTSKYKINTMGRANVYSKMSQFYDFAPSYIGSGVGTVLQQVRELGFHAYQLLHNDVLSFYIELGFVGFTLFWLAYWFLLNRLSKRVGASQYTIIVALYVYSFLLWTTDNVSIYINYFYPFYMMILAIMYADKQEKEEGYDGKTR